MTVLLMILGGAFSFSITKVFLPVRESEALKRHNPLQTRYCREK